MDRNLPATTSTADARYELATDGDRRQALAPRRPLSVAFLPLALVTFIILALTIAAWTFLAAAG